MSDSIFNNTGLIVNPPDIPSFGNAGQVYNADIFGGFNVSAEKNNILFDFNRNNPGVANAGSLTNLTEAGKIGSTMSFVATHVGVRVVKFGANAALSFAEAQAAKSLIQSALIEIKYGSNETKVGEFSGLHFAAPVDFVAEDSAKTAAVQGGSGQAANWIKLSYPIQIEKNLNISGSVKFNATVPASLYSTANSFGFIVMLYGVKIVEA